MNSYQRLKKKLEDVSLENKLLKQDIFSLVINPNSYRSLEIKSITWLQYDIEQIIIYGHRDLNNG